LDKIARNKTKIDERGKYIRTSSESVKLMGIMKVAYVFLVT